jgi:hypothetical protein
MRCYLREGGQDATDSDYGLVAWFFKDDDEHSGSIKDENFQRLNIIDLLWKSVCPYKIERDFVSTSTYIWKSTVRIYLKTEHFHLIPT